MTERKILAGILADKDNLSFKSYLEEADYLIANGVVVLPVLPERKVYETTEFLDGTPAPEIYTYYDQFVYVGVDHKTDGHIFLYDSMSVDYADIGNTLFFSMEDAENSLRRTNNGT